MTINQKTFRARHGLSVGDDTSVVDSINNTGQWTGSSLNPDKGGTGLQTYSAGDLLYSGVSVTVPAAGQTSNQSLSKLAIGSAGKILRSTGTAPAYSTSTFPDSASTTAGTFLRSDGTNFVNSTLVLPNAFTQNTIWFGNASNGTSEIAAAASSILITNSSNVPSWSTTLPAHTVTTSVTVPTIYGQSATGGTLTLRANSTDTTSGTIAITTATGSTSTSTGALTVAGGVGITGKLYVGDIITSTVSVSLTGTGNNLGTITTGTWNGSVIGMTYGGAGAALTASTGGIVYSGASSLSILAGVATANRILVSGASAAPSWTTATYPTTVTGAGKHIVSTGNDTFGVSTAAYPTTAGTSGTLLRSNGTDIGNTTFTIPTTIAANSIFYASAADTLSASSNLTWNESVLNLGSAVLLKIANATTTANTFLTVNGNNTGLEYKTVIGGFGINVTAGAGTLTIAQSGSIAGQTVPNASTFGTFKVGQNMLVGAMSSTVTKAITAISWASTGGGTATYTSANHGLTTGASVAITGVLVAGNTSNTYNGVYTITNVLTNTFDVVIGANPGAYQSGGTIYYNMNNVDSTNVLDLRVGAAVTINNLIAGYSTNDQTAKVFNVSTSGQITATDKLLISKTDANNSSTVALAKFTHSTSGSPAIGIGTIVEFETQTTAGLKVGSSLESLATAVTSSSEGFEFRVNNMNAGALTPNLVVKQNLIAGSTSASYNLTIKPTTNATNGVLTLSDAYVTNTSGSTSISGTVTNTVIDSTALSSCRVVKYIVQITQGTNYDCKEILVMHDGTTPVWNEYSGMTIGTIAGSLTYDFIANGTSTNLEFRMSGTSLPTTVVKVVKTAITQ